MESLQRFALLLCCICYCVSSVFGAIQSKDEERLQHFRDFSLNLLFQSDMDEFSMEKGAAIAAPFGVGYMLANVNEQMWNVSRKGISAVLGAPSQNITDEYVNNLVDLKTGKVETSSSLFTKERNMTTSSMPMGSQLMKTDMKYVNYITDWRNSWYAMNDHIVNSTSGNLDDQLIPKGGWWGGAFYHFTMGSYINTFHYKSAWANTWSKLEKSMNFSDGYSAQFFETQGSFPFLAKENYAAIAVPLKGGNKSVVFVLPNGKLSEFLKNDMHTLFSKEASFPNSWNTSVVKAVVPVLNITLLDQHYKKLELLGINYTFCVDETHHMDVMKHKGPFFMSPIVQAHHFEISPEFVEVASATGANVNSEAKLREELPDYDFSPENVDSLAASDTSEEDATYPPTLVQEDYRSVPLAPVQVRHSREDNVASLEAVPSASSVEEVVDEATTTSPVVLDDVPEATDSPLVEVVVVPVVVEEQKIDTTLMFDRPFFWYLYDDQMGPIFFGSVNSLATYKKEYGLENEEDLWLFDAYKTLLWNCP